MSGSVVHSVVAFVLAFIYLSLLGWLSRWARRSTRAQRWAGHPLLFGMALGVYASTWTFYGSVGFATRYGYGFAAISLGVVLACLAIPLLWDPLARIIRELRLSSVADLFAFRFQSRTVGMVCTLFLLAGLLPYVSLQLRAIGDAALHLSGGKAGAELSLGYTLLLTLFAALVGTDFADPWRHQSGLLVVLAAETLCKLVALLWVGGFVMYEAFGGPSGFLGTLERSPEVLTQLYEPVGKGTFPALVVSAFFAAFLLPRQFHVAFVLRPSRRALNQATWTVPVVLLLLNLPLPLLLVAGQRMTSTHTSPDLYVLLAASSPWVRTVAFLGGVSAASAMVLVSTLALSGMVVHHLWQPFAGGSDLMARTRSIRPLVVLLVILAAFALHTVLPRQGSLVDLGLISFTAVLQLVPPLFGTLFWARASRAGFFCGLAAGVLTWVVTSWLPLFGILPDALAQGGQGGQGAAVLDHGQDVWTSLGVNSICFVLGSLWSPASAKEAAAAVRCRARHSTALVDMPPDSVQALEERITNVLGPETAHAEVERARLELGLPRDEQRIPALVRLAERAQRNLAEALGPLRARTAVFRARTAEDPTLLGAQLWFLEERLAGAAQQSLEQRTYGFLLAALGDLPVGLCAVDSSGRVAVWNQALVTISGVNRDRAMGAPLGQLESPFRELLQEEAVGSREVDLEPGQRPRTLRIHRSRFPDGVLVMFEDLTEEKALQDHLTHHDRLASLGHLAAGVAHEIGNPLSGLLMVAQNLRGELSAGDAPQRLEAILREGRRIEAIVRSLLTFSHRGSTRQRVPIAVLKIVDEAVALVNLGQRGHGRPVEVIIPSELEVHAEPQSLVQVVVNLLTNALDASPPGEAVLVRATGHGGLVLLDVEDQGPGVAPELEPMLFSPFTTTKDPGQGTGLGLAVSLRIAQDHGGDLSYSRTPEGRTRFRLTLPRERPWELAYESHSGG